MSRSLSIFFPALNEGRNIEKTIKKAEAFLEKKKFDYEIIVVNDSFTTDDTSARVKKLSNKNPRVIFIQNRGHGYGSGLKKGFASSTKELIFFTDADLQFDINDLDKLLKHIDTYDYVIGYRRRRSDPFIRNFNAKAYGLLVRLLLGVHVKDVDCAFKLFHASDIKSIKMKSTGALISAEILYKLQQKKYTFTEVPVRHFERKYGKPTGANIRVILNMFIELFRLKFNLQN